MARPDEKGAGVDTAVGLHGNGKSHPGMQLSTDITQDVRASRQSIDQECSRLALFYDINRRLVNAADWEEVVDLLVRVPAEVVDAVGCVFLSFDERTERLALEGAWGLTDDDLLALQLHLQELPDPLRCLTCRPRLAHSGDSCPLLPPQLTEESNAGSILCLHLAQGEHTVGFLSIYLSTATAPSSDDIRLLNAIAGEMAAVVAVAQLRAREPVTSSSLDPTIHTRLDRREMLEQLEWRAILEERARLAREIHDGVAQELVHLNLRAQQAMRRLKQNRLAEAEADLAEIRAAVQDLSAEVRAAIHGLRTPFEHGRPFLANLKACVNRIAARTDIPIELETGDSALNLSPAIGVQVLRIVQEALNNVVQHAGAHQAAVQVRENSSGLRIVIEDDGHGFDPVEASMSSRPSTNSGRGYGLRIMRERTGILGAQLDIRSNGHGGTAVTLRLPRRVPGGGQSP
ncbi:MAG: GAF domain-containing sensor histidine kinase [Anaerolineae bacterium]